MIFKFPFGFSFVSFYNILGHKTFQLFFPDKNFLPLDASFIVL
jgi:hypothetical protein